MRGKHKSGAAVERVCHTGGQSKLRFLISCASKMFEILDILLTIPKLYRNWYSIVLFHFFLLNISYYNRCFIIHKILPKMFIQFLFTVRLTTILWNCFKSTYCTIKHCNWVNLLNIKHKLHLKKKKKIKKKNHIYIHICIVFGHADQIKVHEHLSVPHFGPSSRLGNAQTKATLI